MNDQVVVEISMDKADPSGDYKFKIVLLGSFGVGKTSLVRRFVDDVFFDKYDTTIGVSIKKKSVSIDGKSLILSIWDTEGFDEQNPSIRNSYVAGANGYLLVCDGTRKTTLDQALELNENLQPRSGSIPFFLMINKYDLTELWKFSDEDILNVQSTLLQEEGLKDLTAQRMFKTSAKENISVQEVFFALARQIIENTERYNSRKELDAEL